MLFTSRYSSCCDKNNNDLLRELSPLRNRKIHLKLTAPLPAGEFYDEQQQETFRHLTIESRDAIF